MGLNSLYWPHFFSLKYDCQDAEGVVLNNRNTKKNEKKWNNNVNISFIDVHNLGPLHILNKLFDFYLTQTLVSMSTNERCCGVCVNPITKINLNFCLMNITSSQNVQEVFPTKTTTKTPLQWICLAFRVKRAGWRLNTEYWWHC